MMRYDEEVVRGATTILLLNTRTNSANGSAQNTSLLDEVCAFSGAGWLTSKEIHRPARTHALTGYGYVLRNRQLGVPCAGWHIND